MIMMTLLVACDEARGMTLRNDVLIVVNDNSVNSPQLGAYYAQQRGIDPANIVHVRVPDSYFIGWNDFRRLRDQLIHFMQLNTLDDPTLLPALCLDGEPPYYCTAATDQLRLHSRIRYLVTTSGVPTRMTVAGSTLPFATAPTSVDNYLKYWLLNTFTADVQLKFTEREVAFGDGRGMRTINPAVDRELIVGRIDGLNLDAAKNLVDRSLKAERQGIYGTLYGSTQFFSWRNAATRARIYPVSGSPVAGWRYLLGVWREDLPECAAYLDFNGKLPEGKAPAHCRVQFNDDSNPARQATLGINYRAPGNPDAREPQVVDALVYQGWLDGSSSIGSFNALLNWRKNAMCTSTLCDTAADPAACRAASTDVFSELDTRCVGAADGFMAYNHQSYPLSYFTLWPSGWTGPTAGGGDMNQLAFSEVRSDFGFDDNFSLWFRNTDQVVDPRCYTSSNFTQPASTACLDARRLFLTQTISLGNTPFDPNNPPIVQVSLRYMAMAINQSTPLRVHLFVHDIGSGKEIDYGVATLATLASGNCPWTPAQVQFPLDPLQQTTAGYDRIRLIFDTPNTFSGTLGLDTISVQRSGDNTELAINGSFNKGHNQVALGDHAATFLDRFGGVASWGSVSHHQSGGCAFCANGLETMIYFMRGLPLGDAVWFDESNNSGILYGDPVYSPVAVRLNPVNTTDTLSGFVELYGSTVNGRDPTQVSTTYRVDLCPGRDFFTCDQLQSWQATGISGSGGSENAELGVLDTTSLTPGDYTLRLQVDSLHTLTGRSQRLADYYPVMVQAAAPGSAPTEIASGNTGGSASTEQGSDNKGGGGCVLQPRSAQRKQDVLLLLWLIMAVLGQYINLRKTRVI